MPHYDTEYSISLATRVSIDNLRGDDPDHAIERGEEHVNDQLHEIETLGDLVALLGSDHPITHTSAMLTSIANAEPPDHLVDQWIDERVEARARAREERE